MFRCIITHYLEVIKTEEGEKLQNKMKGRFPSVLSMLLVISGTFLTRQSCKPFVTSLHLELMAAIVFNSFNFQCLFTESIHATNLCPQDLEFLHINLEFIKEYTEAST